MGAHLVKKANKMTTQNTNTITCFDCDGIYASGNDVIEMGEPVTCCSNCGFALCKNCANNWEEQEAKFPLGSVFCSSCYYNPDTAQTCVDGEERSLNEWCMIQPETPETPRVPDQPWCSSNNRCEDCAHCQRTKVCDMCECVGGCYDHCEYIMK